MVLVIVGGDVAGGGLGVVAGAVAVVATSSAVLLNICY